MVELGNKIALKRKDLGLTQSEFAEKMSVTRQTVSRWEAGTAMPDIEKIGDIATILGVTCDYLLKDDCKEETGAAPSKSSVSRLLQGITGKTVKLSFFDEEGDIVLVNKNCKVLGFEGNWMKVQADTKKGLVEKLIPVSSVCSFEFAKEDE
jgi:transcriptional regulator with XRE-family HTH domain